MKGAHNMSLMKEYDLEKYGEKWRYMLLDRLRLDCVYYLGNGNRYAPHLWTHDERKQIDLMREVYASLPAPPEWLTLEDIADFEKQMVGNAWAKCDTAKKFYIKYKIIGVPYYYEFTCYAESEKYALKLFLLNVEVANVEDYYVALVEEI